jgi:hypothetical protein
MKMSARIDLSIAGGVCLGIGLTMIVGLVASMSFFFEEKNIFLENQFKTRINIFA